MRKQNGITLIALVITIIILLILAGISISALSGENGLFAKTKLAKEKYAISGAKEELELKIIELRLEIERKGENLTKEHLPKLNSDEIDVGSTQNFPVGIIYGKYKFNIDENFIVTYVEEADGTIITYTTEPKGYTNEDEIKISIKISNLKGIETIEYPNGDKLEVNGATQKEIDYTVTTNATYTFKVMDKDNNEVIKDIVIDQIDKLEPIDFTPEVEKDGSTITIISNAQDAETDGISTKSGIAYCEYYLKSEEETEYTKYEINKIENLAVGTYQIYVIAYDRAGNSKQSETIEVKISIQFEKISGGSGHYIAIDKEGNLYSWGRGDYGQLGNGKTTESLYPFQIANEIKFKDVCASEQSSLAIDNEGNLLGWGYNSNGELGLGSNVYTYELKKVNEGIKFDKIVAMGDGYSLVQDTQGNIYGAGDNRRGVLGNGKSAGWQKEFTLIEQIKDFNYISAGSVATLAIDNEGKLWVWGQNTYGQFGNGKKDTTISTEPMKIECEQVFKQISVGDRHCLAIDINNKLWAWGDSYTGNESNEYSTVPIQIKSDTEFKEIYAGDGYSMAIDKEGKLWTWGSDSGHVLGDGGSQTNSNKPINIKSDVKFEKIIGNDYYTGMAIDINGNIWTWGNNRYGQYGNNTATDSSTPIQVN